MKKKTTRFLLIMLGWAVLLAGVVMIPYPGPGWLVVFLGLSILAREFTWAERLHGYATSRYDIWQKWIKRQPIYIQSIFWMLTFTTIIVTLWLLNTYGYINDWLNLGLDWLKSPFFS